MDVKIVSAITRLANYMPLGSYVIYTALETYSFSLGTTPTPMTTIVQTEGGGNYTCDFIPGAAFTFSTCTDDQSSALIISLCIGFFLAVFLSFLKQVPPNGTPPLADEDDSKTKKRKYRKGIVYAQGNYYYLDFGDSHIWGHAALSSVAFGTLSLFSASVSQCLFPSVRPWIFVFTQIILLITCCFIAMFWIDDPSLSIGLMVVPQTDSISTQTGSGSIGPKPSATTSGANGTTNNASTSTTALNTTGFTLSPNPSPTASGLTNVALAGAVINSAMSTTSILSGSTATGGTGVGYGVSRMTSTASATKRGRQMSSLNEKQSLEDSDQEYQTWENVNDQGQDRRDEVITTTTTTTTEEYVQSTVRSAPEREADHVSLKME